MRVAQLIIFGILLPAMLVVGCDHDPNAWRDRTDSLTAYMMMQTFVERRLKSPKSADFPNPLVGQHKHVRHIGDHTYVIDSWVDAQNSFGADIRTRFVGKVQQVSDVEWRLVELAFDE